MATQPEKDDVTGTETTGHEWDGIKELNTPLPRWWLYTFYVTVLVAIVYMVLMPAIPLFDGYTKGVLNWSSRASLASSIEAADAAQKPLLDKVDKASLKQIQDDPNLLSFALAGGRSAFELHCSQCHGQGAQGYKGYPNLNDDAWIWGGTLDDIHHTIEYGIRNANPDSRNNVMAAYGRDQILTPEQIDETAEYVLSLSGRADDKAAAEKGKAIFAEQCAACHGDNGKGNTELGAPNLTDAIWLYGGSKQEIVDTLINGRGGVMPAWGERLSPATVKLLTVYVHSLGGGT